MMGIFQIMGSLNERLPVFFGQNNLNMVFWAYALWQIVRGNKLIAYTLSLVFTSLLTLVRLRKESKHNVIIDGPCEILEVDKHYKDARNCKAIPELGLESISCLERGGWYSKTMYKGCWYYCQLNSIATLIHLGAYDDLVFYNTAIEILPEKHLGERLSPKEGIGRILITGSASKVKEHVIPMLYNTEGYNGRIWGSLSTLPILAQAYGFNSLSFLLGMIVIILDFFRNYVYGFYLYATNPVIRFIKLNIFKKRSYLYTAFSMFSTRWAFCDKEKGYSYVAEPSTEFRVLASYTSTKDDDLDFLCVGKEKTFTNDTDQRTYFSKTQQGVCHMFQIKGEVTFMRFMSHKPVYVSDASLV